VEPNEALNAILNLPSLDLAGMERAKSAAFRLRDTGQWKAQFYGHAKILQHDKSIPKITDLCKSIEYSHTPFEALIPDKEEWGNRADRARRTQSVSIQMAPNWKDTLAEVYTPNNYISGSHSGSRTTVASFRRRFTL